MSNKKFQKIKLITSSNASENYGASIDILFEGNNSLYKDNDALRIIVEKDGNIRIIKSSSFPYVPKILVEDFGYDET